MHLKSKLTLILQLSSFSLIIIFFYFVPAAFAIGSSKEINPKASKEPIVVNGDNVEYFQDQKMVTGTGNVSIKYEDVILTCDKITVYLDTKEAIAEGNVKVTQKGSFLTGERMNYNFETKKGTILKAYVNSKPFYGKAEEINKASTAGNKDQYKLNEGYVTTCDLDNPHYRIRAKELIIYPGDKIIAKHIVVYIGNVPVLYWPQYVQPMEQRKSQITFIPGTRSGWGYYGLTSYRYYLGDQNRGDLLLDYRTKLGLAEGVNHYYHTTEIGDGAIKLYYTNENQFAYDPKNPVTDRYRWQVRHSWDMGEGTDTVATFEFNKMSDPNFIKDYFYNEYQELGPEPDNYLTFITQKENYTTEFLIRGRVNPFEDVVDRLPEFSINIPDYNIKNTGAYYKANASASYLDHQFNNTGNAAWDTVKDQASGRIDVFNQLSYPLKLFKMLSTSPYVADEETYYSRLATGSMNDVRNLFSAGIDNSMKFYKTYDVSSNFLGIDINKLRHIITPTANYYFVPAPNIDHANIYQFDTVDALDEQTGVLFGLENRIQTKRPDAEGNMKSVDLATLQINTNYECRLNKNDLSVKHDTFNGFQTKLELIPYDWAYVEAELDTDPKTCEMQRSSLDLVTHWKDKWSVAISERYQESTQTDPQDNGTLLTCDITYKINEKWKVRVYERYNTQTSSIEEQEYTITRDLHCWYAELTYDVDNNGGHNLWMEFHLKAFPDTPVGYKQTYSHPRFGEAGTQQ